ncbi:unnamed protein product, partial [Nesidiocoris tenuis]
LSIIRATSMRLRNGRSQVKALGSKMEPDCHQWRIKPPSAWSAWKRRNTPSLPTKL